jgi:hypothetical protein
MSRDERLRDEAPRAGGWKRRIERFKAEVPGAPEWFQDDQLTDAGLVCLLAWGVKVGEFSVAQAFAHVAEIYSRDDTPLDDVLTIQNTLHDILEHLGLLARP